MAALQYSDVPGYHALLLRPSLIELQLAGGLIELAHDWLAGTKARWSGETKTVALPRPGQDGAGGATPHLRLPRRRDDVRRYAGSSLLAASASTNSPASRNTHYRRMFRVLRQATDDSSSAPRRDGTTPRRRARAAPRDQQPRRPRPRVGQEPLRRPHTRAASGVVFLPAPARGQPAPRPGHLHRHARQLPTAERERLLHGDWEIPDDGELFQRDWFTLIEPHQLPPATPARCATGTSPRPNPAPPTPTPTGPSGSASSTTTERHLLHHRHRPRTQSARSDRTARRAKTAKRDGRDTKILIEQEPGAAGKAATRALQAPRPHGAHRLLAPCHRRQDTRACPVAAAAENGLIQLVRGRHTQAFLDELSAFPHGKHDDIVDALAGAHQHCPTRHGHATSFSRRDIRIDFDPLEMAKRREYLPIPGHDPGEHLARALGVTITPGRPAGRPGLHPDDEGARGGFWPPAAARDHTPQPCVASRRPPKSFPNASATHQSGITLDTYSHVLPSMQAQAVEAFDLVSRAQAL